MLIGIVTVVLDLTLSLSLVPSFGLLGATTSRILVDIAGFLIAVYLIRNYLAGVADVVFYAKVIDHVIHHACRVVFIVHIRIEWNCNIDTVRACRRSNSFLVCTQFWAAD